MAAGVQLALDLVEPLALRREQAPAQAVHQPEIALTLRPEGHHDRLRLVEAARSLGQLAVEIAQALEQRPVAGERPRHEPCRRLEGTVTADIDGEEREVGAGGALIVPSGVLHQLHNRGAGELRKIAVLGRVGARTFWPDGTPLETPWQE